MRAPAWRRARWRWDAYWTEPGPLLDLACARVAIVACALAALAVWASPAELAALERTAREWRPVWIARLLQGRSPPGPAVAAALFAATGAAGWMALVGARTRISMPCFALGHLVLQAWRVSWHRDHLHALLAIALLVLACSPCGGALSVDAARARRRGEGPRPLHADALWPLRLIGWSLAVAYASAAASKLVGGGPTWVDGATLQHYAAVKGIAKGAPLGAWMVAQHGLAGVLCACTVLFEATFGLAVARPRWRWVHLPVGCAFHLLVWLVLAAPFYAFPVLYAALVPWSRALEALRRAVRAPRGILGP